MFKLLRTRSDTDDAERSLRELHEFMPAALEITESPPLPRARTITWTIILFFIALVLWATLGKVDIVVSASGKVIPDGYVKVIEPLETGLVTGLMVEEGQLVKAGDVLLTLDTTASAADLGRLRAEADGIGDDVIRLRSLRETLLAGKTPVDAHVDAGAADALDNSLFHAELREYFSQRNAIDADIARARAANRTLEGEIRNLAALLPITRERVDNLQTLARDNLVPRQQHLDARQELLAQEGNLQTTRNRRQEVQAEITSLEERRKSLLAEIERRLLEREQELLRRHETLKYELAKADKRRELQTLRAPVDGYVKQLMVHTVGSVVSTGEELMQIVPATSVLRIEALVENKDVGFIHAGQPVSIKIDAFPFTKYGLIEGVLDGVSPDSIFQENIGLVYKARVIGDLEKAPKAIRLVPGMTATVEVKTGKRRIIELFLSPLLKYRQESLRER